MEHLSFLAQAFLITKWEQWYSYSGSSDLTSSHKYNAIKYLKLRLRSLKAELELPERHKDESLNLEYRMITYELWLYSKYFIAVMVLIIYSRNPYVYYNTQTVRATLTNYRLDTYGLEETKTIEDLYTYINNTLIQPFNQGLDYDDKRIEEPGWLHFQLAKLLGVVRLQQVRHAVKANGMKSIYFTDEKFMPGWQKTDRKFHYMDKYWRTFEPWHTKKDGGFSTWLLGSTHYGSVYTYWDNRGYMALLARDTVNSQKVLKYLKEQHWLDNRTAALFIDFTLYNVDSNVFTICSLIIEQTPFSSVVWHMKLNSSALLSNIDQFSYWWLFLLFLYALELIQFTKAMILKAWLMPHFFTSYWNRVDVSILTFNFLIFVVLTLRDSTVVNSLKYFEKLKKLEYVDFRVPVYLDYTATLMEGFLVTLITIRIWKVLQFAPIFRLFTRTLFKAAIPLLCSIIGLQIFLMAVSLATQIINGSNTENFARYFTSTTSVISFSFGFSSRTSPKDLSHGGNILGFILYIILMFVIAIFLINLFVTLIIEYLKEARKEREQRQPDQLTYWEFIKAELNPFKLKFKECIKYFSRHDKKRTIADEIEERMDELQMKRIKDALKSQKAVQLKRQTIEKRSSNEIYELEQIKAERMKKIHLIFQTQVELINRLLEEEDTAGESDDEEKKLTEN
uniref:Polycystin cation channel PKD1/PKD2 domain-containing protein n=1 Tax=Glossina brevipalpis TaxID=37001 RepID=A0A1A9VZ73_9MUSC